jgi:transposase-like protein
VEGFGEFADVMHRRGVFMEMLANARQTEFASLTSIAAEMRNNGMEGYKIRKHLEKMVDQKYVEKILQATR